jgi:hypothetical protein
MVDSTILKYVRRQKKNGKAETEIAGMQREGFLRFGKLRDACKRVKGS